MKSGITEGVDGVDGVDGLCEMGKSLVVSSAGRRRLSVAVDLNIDHHWQNGGICSICSRDWL